MRARILIPALIIAAGLSTAAFSQGAPRVVVGDNPSLSGAPLYVALEKGYYREAGIDVQLEMSGTSSDMAVLLATNRLQVVGGALSAGFFNSLSKGLPSAVSARGAILVYALAKILEAGGLSLGDVDLKYIPFGQMATALTTGAVDAALMIS